MGIAQGVTEFFPVSSSGHLVILQSIFGFKEPMLAFDIFLHFATILAVLIFFRKDIIDMIRGKGPMLKFVIIGSIPTFMIGIIFKKFFEGLFASASFAGYSLIVTGIFLLAASFFAIYNKKKRRERELTPAVAAAVGIAQGISAIPGISRSGATISTSLIAGLKDETAVRFSFLLSVPAVLGAGLLKAGEICGNLVSMDAPAFIAGFLGALIAGMLAIRVLFEILKKNMFFLFGVYCILAGCAAVLLVK